MHLARSQPRNQPVSPGHQHIGQNPLIGLTWAFFQHLFSGLRHLVLDTGAGYELKTNKLWSIVVIAGGVFATAASWLYIMAEAL